MYNITIINDNGSYFIVIQTRSKQCYIKWDFLKVDFVAFRMSLFLKNFYMFRVNYIGPPGSSCLADVKTLWNEPVLEEKVPFLSWRFWVKTVTKKYLSMLSFRPQILSPWLKLNFQNALFSNFYFYCCVTDLPVLRKKGYICHIWPITAKIALKRGSLTWQQLVKITLVRWKWN